MVEQQRAPTYVGFRNYFEQLEAHLGAVLVPIQPRATGPRQIVTSEALHADLARKAAVEVYRENHCRGMESPVRLFPTLDALGRLRFKAEESNTTDQASIEFLESLGEATLLILGAQATSDSEPDPNSSW
jgi:hypothetical protein